jgi:hypothetical protein
MEELQLNHPLPLFIKEGNKISALTLFIKEGNKISPLI